MTTTISPQVTYNVQTLHRLRGEDNLNTLTRKSEPGVDGVRKGYLQLKHRHAPHADQSFRDSVRNGAKATAYCRGGCVRVRVYGRAGGPQSPRRMPTVQACREAEHEFRLCSTAAAFLPSTTALPIAVCKRRRRMLDGTVSNIGFADSAWTPRPRL